LEIALSSAVDIPVKTEYQPRHLRPETLAEFDQGLPVEDLVDGHLVGEATQVLPQTQLSTSGPLPQRPPGLTLAALEAEHPAQPVRLSLRARVFGAFGNAATPDRRWT
jgi:hypothetical protein